MAGPGVALRLHEFRESQDARGPDGPTTSTPQTLRLGKDVHGLYPGQLGRVHTVHPKDCGYNCHSGRSQSLHESPNNQETYLQSFDIRTLRALTVLQRRPLQTTYQDEFGLQAPPSPQ